MKRIKLLIPVLALTLFSCDQYLDVNESPNSVFFEDATPNKLLPGAQLSTFRVQATTMNQLGNVFMNSWTRNVQGFGNGFDRELQLQIDNGFYTGIWDGLFRNLKNFQAIIDYPNPSGKYDHYVAAAKICKAHYMQQIVDLYGDAPYSEAWEGNANTTPSYDDDYAIYQDVITNLEEARFLIANAPADVEDISAFDIMLGGDMPGWEAFSNAIQLRMCLRMSENTGAVATYRDSKLADIAGASFPTGDISINPGFNAATNANQNPASGFLFFDAANNAVQNLSFIAMTGHAYKSLTSYANTNYPAAGSQEIISGSGVFYPNVTDARRTRIFRNGASQPVLRAVNQGSSLVDVTTPAGTLPGLPGRNNYYKTVGYTPAISAFSQIHEADGYVMTYSEVCFLLAEAAARFDNGEAGYAGFTGAQSWFDAGISSDFAHLASAAGPAYIAAINAKPNFGYTASTTFDEKLHAIMYQKWVALMGINAIQSYIDYTRTGYPLTPLSSNAVQTRKPYRLIYPVSEYVANSANVPAMTTSEIFTINAKTPFWVQ